WLSGEVIEFPLSTHLTVAGGITLLFAAQYALLSWLRRGPFFTQRRWGRLLVGIIFLALLGTHGTHLWAAANSYQPVTAFTRFLPLFHPATANSFMRKSGLVDAEALARQDA